MSSAHPHFVDDPVFRQLIDCAQVPRSALEALFTHTLPSLSPEVDGSSDDADDQRGPRQREDEQLMRLPTSAIRPAARRRSENLLEQERSPSTPPIPPLPASSSIQSPQATAPRTRSQARQNPPRPGPSAFRATGTLASEALIQSPPPPPFPDVVEGHMPGPSRSSSSVPPTPSSNQSFPRDFTSTDNTQAICALMEENQIEQVVFRHDPDMLDNLLSGMLDLFNLDAQLSSLVQTRLSFLWVAANIIAEESSPRRYEDNQVTIVFEHLFPVLRMLCITYADETLTPEGRALMRLLRPVHSTADRAVRMPSDLECVNHLTTRDLVSFLLEYKRPDVGSEPIKLIFGSVARAGRNGITMKLINRNGKSDLDFRNLDQSEVPKTRTNAEHCLSQIFGSLNAYHTHRSILMTRDEMLVFELQDDTSNKKIRRINVSARVTHDDALSNRAQCPGTFRKRPAGGDTPMRHRFSSNDSMEVDQSEALGLQPTFLAVMTALTLQPCNKPAVPADLWLDFPPTVLGTRHQGRDTQAGNSAGAQGGNPAGAYPGSSVYPFNGRGGNHDFLGGGADQRSGQGTYHDDRFGVEEQQDESHDPELHIGPFSRTGDVIAPLAKDAEMGEIPRRAPYSFGYAPHPPRYVPLSTCNVNLDTHCLSFQSVEGYSVSGQTLSFVGPYAPHTICVGKIQVRVGPDGPLLGSGRIGDVLGCDGWGLGDPLASIHSDISVDGARASMSLISIPFSPGLEEQSHSVESSPQSVVLRTPRGFPDKLALKLICPSLLQGTDGVEHPYSPEQAVSILLHEGREAAVPVTTVDGRSCKPMFYGLFKTDVLAFWDSRQETWVLRARNRAVSSDGSNSEIRELYCALMQRVGSEIRGRLELSEKLEILSLIDAFHSVGKIHGDPNERNILYAHPPLSAYSDPMEIESAMSKRNPRWRPQMVMVDYETTRDGTEGERRLERLQVERLIGSR